VRIENTDAKAELILGHLDRQLQVGVVGDDHGDVAVALEGIE
jgi:hypothetical protein